MNFCLWEQQIKAVQHYDQAGFMVALEVSYTTPAWVQEGRVDEAGEAVDAELERNFQKRDFARMAVIGQFNLGFILARLGREIFIIDQHAADEKYNFERLQQVTRLNRQPLVHPQKLQLTPAQAVTLRCTYCSCHGLLSLWVRILHLLHVCISRVFPFVDQ